MQWRHKWRLSEAPASNDAVDFAGWRYGDEPYCAGVASFHPESVWSSDSVHFILKTKLSCKKPRLHQFSSTEKQPPRSPSVIVSLKAGVLVDIANGTLLWQKIAHFHNLTGTEMCHAGISGPKNCALQNVCAQKCHDSAQSAHAVHFLCEPRAPASQYSTPAV